MMFKLTSVAASLLVLAVGLAPRAHATAPAPDYGVVATHSSVVGRVIDIKPGTRYLNVRNGEVVTIHMGDTSFTWEVSTATNVTAIPLAKVAPAGTPATVTWVYISESALYEGD